VAGVPPGAIFDFQCILYNAATGGSQVGPIRTLEDVAVTGGIFTVELDCTSPARLWTLTINARTAVG
jgi:hypothetical protein